MHHRLLITLIVFVTIAAGQATTRDEYITQLFRRDSGGWTAGDATISVPLPDGRALWLFGDSYIVDVRKSDTTLPCLFQVRNAVMVQNGTQFKTLLDTTQTGLQRTFCRDYPNYDDSLMYWPGSGFVADDTVYIFVHHTDQKTMAVYATCVARLHYPDLKLINISTIGELAKIYFGVSVLYDTASNYYYTYGMRGAYLSFEVFAARFKYGHLLDPWEFYAGTGWSTDPSKAVKISTYGMGACVGVVKRNGRWYMFSQENGFLTPGGGRHIYVYDSDKPEGPFTGQKLLYTIEDKWKGQYLVTYNAMPHPEVYRDSISISYNVNGNDSTCKKDIWTERLNADCYRPKFIAVPYSMFEKVGIVQAITKKGSALPIAVSNRLGRSILHITPASNASSPIDLQVFDIRGRSVYSCNVPLRQVLNVTLESIAPGLYEIAAFQDKSVARVYFVKLPGNAPQY